MKNMKLNPLENFQPYNKYNTMKLILSFTLFFNRMSCDSIVLQDKRRRWTALHYVVKRKHTLEVNPRPNKFVWIPPCKAAERENAKYICVCVLWILA